MPPRPRLQLLALDIRQLNLHNKKRWHDPILPACTRINASGH
jgi:hypothetical protein